MTVSIGAVDLNESLYLDGIENAKKIATSKFTHLAGTSTVQVMTLSGGRTLTLTTVSEDGSLTGIFCQSQIDQLKTIEEAGIAVAMVYRDRGTFNVLVTNTNFKQFNQREPVHPGKAYTGSITTIEV